MPEIIYFYIYTCRSAADVIMSTEQLSAFLKTKLEQRSTNIREAFRRLDRSNTGFVSADDLSSVLNDFNIRMTRAALQALLAKYDANGDGVVSYEEVCRPIPLCCRTSSTPLLTGTACAQC